MALSLEQAEYLNEQLCLGCDEVVFDDELKGLLAEIYQQAQAAIIPESSSVTAAPKVEFSERKQISFEELAQQNKTKAARPAMGGGMAKIDKSKSIFKAPAKSSAPATVWSNYEDLQGLNEAMMADEFYEREPQHNFQKGYGASKAGGLMVLGYMPTVQDISLQKPWSGADGDLLMKMLGAIGVDLNSCYRSWLVKCPTGRVMPRQIQKLVGMVEQEVRVVRPKAILALGEGCAKGLFKVGLDGGFYELGGVKTMVTYDPGFLLQQPGFKRPAWAHLQKLQAYMNLK